MGVGSSYPHDVMAISGGASENNHNNSHFRNTFSSSTRAIGDVDATVASSTTPMFSTHETAELLLASRTSIALLRHTSALLLGSNYHSDTSSSLSSSPRTLLVSVMDSFKAHSGDVLALDSMPNKTDVYCIQSAERMLAASASRSLTNHGIASTEEGVMGMVPLVSGAGVSTTKPKTTTTATPSFYDPASAVPSAQYRSALVYSVGNDHKARQWSFRALDSTTYSSLTALASFSSSSSSASSSGGCVVPSSTDGGVHLIRGEGALPLPPLSQPTTTTATATKGRRVLPTTPQPFLSRLCATASTFCSSHRQLDLEMIGGGGGSGWDLRVNLADNLTPDTPAPPTVIPQTKNQNQKILPVPGNSSSRGLGGGAVLSVNVSRRSSNASSSCSPAPVHPWSGGGGEDSDRLGYFLPRVRTASGGVGVGKVAARGREDEPSSLLQLGGGGGGNSGAATVGGGMLPSSHLGSRLSSPPSTLLPPSKGASTTMGVSDEVDGDEDGDVHHPFFSATCGLPLPDVLHVGYLLLSTGFMEVVESTEQKEPHTTSVESSDFTTAAGIAGAAMKSRGDGVVQQPSSAALLPVTTTTSPPLTPFVVHLLPEGTQALISRLLGGCGGGGGGEKGSFATTSPAAYPHLLLPDGALLAPHHQHPRTLQRTTPADVVAATGAAAAPSHPVQEDEGFSTLLHQSLATIYNGDNKNNNAPPAFPQQGEGEGSSTINFAMSISRSLVGTDATGGRVGGSGAGGGGGASRRVLRPKVVVPMSPRVYHLQQAANHPPPTSAPSRLLPTTNNKNNTGTAATTAALTIVAESSPSPSPRGSVITTSEAPNHAQLATLYSMTNRVNHREHRREKEIRQVHKQARRLSMSLLSSSNVQQQLPQQHRRKSAMVGAATPATTGGNNDVTEPVEGETYAPPSPSFLGSGATPLIVEDGGGGGVSPPFSSHSQQLHLMSEGNDSAPPTSDTSPPFQTMAITTSSAGKLDPVALQQQVDAAVWRSAQERRQLKLRRRRLKKLSGRAYSSSSSSLASLNTGSDDNDDGFVSGSEQSELRFAFGDQQPVASVLEAPALQHHRRHHRHHPSSPGSISSPARSSSISLDVSARLLFTDGTITMPATVGAAEGGGGGGCSPFGVFSSGVGGGDTDSPPLLHGGASTSGNNSPTTHQQQQQGYTPPATRFANRAASIWDEYYSPPHQHHQSPSSSSPTK